MVPGLYPKWRASGSSKEKLRRSTTSNIEPVRRRINTPGVRGDPLPAFAGMTSLLYKCGSSNCHSSQTWDDKPAGIDTAAHAYAQYQAGKEIRGFQPQMQLPGPLPEYDLDQDIRALAVLKK